MAMIVTRSRGGEDAILLEARVHELADEFRDQVDFRTQLVEAYGPPELLIAIIGALAGSIAQRVIDKLFEREEDTRNVTIIVIHQDSGVVFNLPADNQKCVEHFIRLEQDSERTSSAAG